MHHDNVGADDTAMLRAWRRTGRMWWVVVVIVAIGAMTLAACGDDDGDRVQDAQAPTAVADPPRLQDGDSAPDAPVSAPSGDQNGNADPGAPITLAVGPGLSVPDAINSTLDEVLLVNGFIVVTNDVTRLCEALAESFPPQCGGAFLIVEGLSLDLVDGLERSGDIQWTNFPVQVLGEVDGGTITVSGTSKG
jgi:hypothetical protein